MIENFESKFLAFARSKPADERYRSHEYTSCALAQFVVSRGYVMGARGYGNSNETQETRNEFLYPAIAFNAAIPMHAEEPRTWGALVQRLIAAGVEE